MVNCNLKKNKGKASCRKNNSKKGFKELNSVERRLMINGLKADIAMKCGKKISESSALRILKLSTLSAQKRAIKKIKRSC
jgi:hypothetical protein